MVKRTRLVIPEASRAALLNFAHESHQGVIKTKSLLREKVWWPNINLQTEDLMKSRRASKLRERLQYKGLSYQKNHKLRQDPRLHSYYSIERYRISHSIEYDYFDVPAQLERYDADKKYTSKRYANNRLNKKPMSFQIGQCVLILKQQSRSDKISNKYGKDICRVMRQDL